MALAIAELYADYTAVFIASVVGVGLVLFSFGLSRILAPRSRSEAQGIPYECGIQPIGENWSQFNVRYYLFGILFLIFDVEAIFIFPWAVVFAEGSPLIFYEMIIFAAVLLFGLLYGWKKGILQWQES